MCDRAANPERPGLQGHLLLVCGVDENGRSYLKKQSFCAPFHLSKTFQDNGVLVANVVNPTAGLFRGDVARSEVRVEAGARLLLTQPSATRVHDTQGGRSETEQTYFVAANSWLEILPELFIPHRGARHRQRTRIQIEPSGELCYLETLAPGRVASGEVFAFEELEWHTEIRCGNQLLVREKFVLSTKNRSLCALDRFSEHTYIATFFLISDRFEAKSDCWPEIERMHADDVWIGFSRLVAGGWVIKILAGESHRLRDTVSAVREKMHRAAGWPLPLARKL
ncbi:MAG TPA: urease accessory protein UreD [Candidatus Methylacidiphilales bacterium]